MYLPPPLNTLTIDWIGNLDAKEGSLLYLTVNGQKFEPVSYRDASTVQVPLCNRGLLNLKVQVMSEPGKKTVTGFSNIFKLIPGQNHTCEISGKVGSWQGMQVRLSKGAQEIGLNDHYCYSKGYVAAWSFLCPIYGLIRTFRSKYNRAEAFWCGAAGFWMSLFIQLGGGKSESSYYSHSHDFSFIEFLLDIVAGGVMFLRGLIRLIFE